MVEKWTGDYVEVLVVDLTVMEIEKVDEEQRITIVEGLGQARR